MVDTVSKTTTAPTTIASDNDDWEVAVDTGEFDKRLEQQEKARAATQETTASAISSSTNDDNSRTSSTINFLNSNKPIRILKRPTSQSQLTTTTNVISSSTATTNNANVTTTSNNDNNTNNSNSPFPTNNSSSTTVPVVSIIPRNPNKDSTNISQSITTPAFSSTPSSTQPTKPAIKTYEQRELEYRLARLRIMGEEESSAKDDDDILSNELTSASADDTTKSTTTSSSSAMSSNTRTTNKISELSQQSLQCHSTPGSYASNLYALSNVPTNTGAIHFTPNNNINNSTPNLGATPYSSPNFPQNFRGAYPPPYSHMPAAPPPPSLIPRYPLPTTTTNTLYMTSTAPFISAPSSSPSSVSSSYNVTPQQHPNITTNNWYHYQHSQMPYGAQQYGPPQ